MRRIIVDGLIVLVGLGALLVLRFYGGAQECQDHPFFALQGTAVDCAAGKIAKQEVPVSKPVAAVASR
jgi:hypothetical protein